MPQLIPAALDQQLEPEKQRRRADYFSRNPYATAAGWESIWKKLSRPSSSSSKPRSKRCAASGMGASENHVFTLPAAFTPRGGYARSGSGGYSATPAAGRVMYTYRYRDCGPDRRSAIREAGDWANGGPEPAGRMVGLTEVN
jgi:hypothetical protein